MPPVLAPLAAHPSRACLLTDFDGTLAPIIEDPLLSRPLPGAVDALRALAARLGLVAVVSGRPTSFLHELMGDGLLLSGLYGLELVRPGTGGLVEITDDVERWRAVVDTVVGEAVAQAPPGVYVEPKGLALTLHNRTAVEAGPWVRSFALDAAERTGLVVHVAKMSLELRPPVTADKGSVVQAFAGGMSAVAYLGDDVGDIPAFAALDALAAEGATCVKVAVGGPELDPRVADAADVIVAGPQACVDLLDELLRLLP